MMEIAKKIEQSFNNHDIELHLSCFVDDAVAINLLEEKEEFSGRAQLKNVLNELFRINPDLKCKIDNISVHEPFVSFEVNLWGFVCGAKNTGVWNCKIEEDKIQKLWFTQ